MIETRLSRAWVVGLVGAGCSGIARVSGTLLPRCHEARKAGKEAWDEIRLIRALAIPGLSDRTIEKRCEELSGFFVSDWFFEVGRGERGGGAALVLTVVPSVMG